MAVFVRQLRFGQQQLGLGISRRRALVSGCAGWGCACCGCGGLLFRGRRSSLCTGGCLISHARRLGCCAGGCIRWLTCRGRRSCAGRSSSTLVRGCRRIYRSAGALSRCACRAAGSCGRSICVWITRWSGCAGRSEALWSDVAGGFTGALALSEDAPAGLLVVAAGAFAFASLDDAAAPAAAPVVAAAALASDGAVLEAWLLVQESEIMFTELTCREPSLPRVPWTWT